LKFPYLPVTIQRPIPSLAGGQVRFRPVVAVMLTGTATPQLRDGLLDTGADDTVFSEAVAAALGLDLAHGKLMPFEAGKSKGGQFSPAACFVLNRRRTARTEAVKDAPALTWYYLGAAPCDGTRPPPLWNHLPFI
jgi:hypothetical protein